MHDDVRRRLEPDGSEIPDGLNSSLDHVVRNVLCKLGGGGNDAQVNAHPLGEIRQLIERQHSLSVNPLADFRGVGIERGHDAQTEIREALVPQKSSAQVADANQKGLIHVVPAKERFDCMDKFSNHIAGLRLSDDPRVLQVFAHLHGYKVQVAPDHAARYAVDSFGFKSGEIMVILWQPGKTWLRYSRPARVSRLLIRYFYIDIHIAILGRGEISSP